MTQPTTVGMKKVTWTPHRDCYQKNAFSWNDKDIVVHWHQPNLWVAFNFYDSFSRGLYSLHEYSSSFSLPYDIWIFRYFFVFIMRNHKMHSFFARFNFECVLLAHNATSESVVCRDNNCHFKWNVEHFLHVELSVFCCLACFVSIQICSVFMSCMLPNN